VEGLEELTFDNLKKENGLVTCNFVARNKQLKTKIPKKHWFFSKISENIKRT
jgi:hypothetical protein